MLFQSGDEIQGKYRVQRLLGQGGQAEVYLVTHLSLGVDRAIKVIAQEMVGVGSQVFADFRRRFAQEAKLGAGLKDARLVQVHDLLESTDLAILEMEYVPGGSLAELIAASKQQGQTLPLELSLIHI